MKNMMAASYGSGLQSPPPIGRPVDRVFEDAQYTGEIYLNGRKLRDYPKLCSKYDLSDTIIVDISRNRLTELPLEVCEYLHVERINCYHNVIRSIPDVICQLQSLTHLILSRNQLAVLPAALCSLNSLEILSVSNNKLVSLPEEIGKLENLMDLDVSCNEISHLPLQIGDLSSLRCLNLRRNFLLELPFEISRLQLFKLDFSSNRIERIPIVFRKMETLEQFILDHNPLSSPPAYICTKGRQHIMKYLHIQAIKEDRKRGILNNDPDMKRNMRKSLPPQQSSDEFRNILAGPESKWKRHTVLSNDSGYSTSDGTDRNGWQSGEVYEENIQGNQDIHLHCQNVLYHHSHHCHVNNPGLADRTKAGTLSCVSTTIYENENSPQPRKDHIDYLPQNRVYSDTYQKHHHLPLYSRNQSFATPTSVSGHVTLYHSPSPNLSRSRVLSPSYSVIGNNNQNATHTRAFSPTQTEGILLRQYSSANILKRQNSESSLSSSLLQNEDLRSNHLLQTNGKTSSNVSTPDVYTSHYLKHSMSRSSSYVQSYELKDEGKDCLSTATLTGDQEDEFTRELKRQKADYERKKKQAEHIRVKQLEEDEEREKEERRRAALKIQEEQKLLLEKQEEMIRQEEAKRLEEKKRKEEEETLNGPEILTMHETLRNQIAEENKLEDIQKTADSKLSDRNKLANNYYSNTHSQTSNYSRSQNVQSLSSSLSHQPPQPPNSLPLHGISGPLSPSQMQSSVSSSSYLMSPQQQQQRNDSNYILTENEYRNALSSQSFKEQRRLTNSSQYRRTTSDTLKKPGQQVDTLNYINRNGENSTLSSTSTTPSVSPSPSPRNSVSHLAKPGSPSGLSSHLTKSNSPMGSMSQLAKPVTSKSSVPRANGPASTGSNQAARRTKITGDSSNASSPVIARSAKTSGIGNIKTSLNPGSSSLRRSSNSSTTDDDSKSKKAPATPTDPPRIKSKLEEQKQRGTLHAPIVKKTAQHIDNTDTNKRVQTRPPTNNFGSNRGRADIKIGMKGLEDSSMLRRRDEAHREEAEQMDRLRQTIESRLRVTLPDNLAEALRDGVVLCHLANQIRPRSVGSIHVPSPAVPKLTVAKCRRNVDNFLDACRKIGVDQEQICGPHDILDEKGISRIAITVGALIAIGTNPKQSAV